MTLFEFMLPNVTKCTTNSCIHVKWRTKYSGNITAFFVCVCVCLFSLAFFGFLWLSLAFFGFLWLSLVFLYLCTIACFDNFYFVSRIFACVCITP